jgi:urease accessory protein
MLRSFLKPKTHGQFFAKAFYVFFLLYAGNAHAHTTDTTGGLMSGLSHPIGGWDHILAMIAVGLWAAQLGRPAIWLLPLSFPVMMAFGAALGLWGAPLPGVEVGIALSAVVLGLMVLGAIRPHVWLALVIVGGFALFHGHAHGTELPSGQSGLLYGLGFVISTAFLHAIGIGIGLLGKVALGSALVRGAGAAVLVGGLYFLGGAAGVF